MRKHAYTDLFWVPKCSTFSESLAQSHHGFFCPFFQASAKYPHFSWEIAWSSMLASGNFGEISGYFFSLQASFHSRVICSTIEGINKRSFSHARTLDRAAIQIWVSLDPLLQFLSADADDSERYVADSRGVNIGTAAAAVVRARCWKKRTLNSNRVSLSLSLSHYCRIVAYLLRKHFTVHRPLCKSPARLSLEFRIHTYIISLSTLVTFGLLAAAFGPAPVFALLTNSEGKNALFFDIAPSHSTRNRKNAPNSE